MNRNGIIVLSSVLLLDEARFVKYRGFDAVSSNQTVSPKRRANLASSALICLFLFFSSFRLSLNACLVRSSFSPLRSLFFNIIDWGAATGFRNPCGDDNCDISEPNLSGRDLVKLKRGATMAFGGKLSGRGYKEVNVERTHLLSLTCFMIDYRAKYFLNYENWREKTSI